MNHLISKQRAILKLMTKEVDKRQKYFLSKPENWQESMTGEKYSSKTDMLEMFVNDTEGSLAEQGFN